MTTELADPGVAECLTDLEWHPSATTAAVSALAVLSAEIGRLRTLTYVFPGGQLVAKLAGSPPSWMIPTIQGLGALLTLPADWDSYGAPRIDPPFIIAALELAAEALPDGTPPPAVVPTSRGGVQFEWHTRSADLEVEFLSPSRLRVFCEDLRTGRSSESEISRDLKPLTDAIAVLNRPT